MTDQTSGASPVLSEGLGPLPEPRTLSRGDEDGAIQLGYTADQMRAYALAERKRIAALIEEHSGLTLETLEYLETMRRGPTPEELAELDRNARA